MDAFSILRLQAEQQRETAIKDARRKCREIIQWVNELEAKLTPPGPTKPQLKRQRVYDLLCRLMPKEREFTTGELLALAKQAEPGRRFNMQTVRNSLEYLQSTKKVCRTRRLDARIQWAVPGCAVLKWPHGVRPVASVAEEVLRERGPMTLVDLLVAVREAGFRAGDDPRLVQRALAKSLYTNRQFRKEGKRWGMGPIRPSPLNPIQ